MDEDENSQSSEFVDNLANMTSEEVSANFFDLFNEALELHPEDRN